MPPRTPAQQSAARMARKRMNGLPQSKRWAGPAVFAKLPVAALPLFWPVSGLASRGVRPSHAVRHSGVRRTPAIVADGACLPLRGQHTLARCRAPCFPFNRPHEHAGEHQNGAIVRPGICSGNLEAQVFVLHARQRAAVALPIRRPAYYGRPAWRWLLPRRTMQAQRRRRWGHRNTRTPPSPDRQPPSRLRWPSASANLP